MSQQHGSNWAAQARRQAYCTRNRGNAEALHCPDEAYEDDGVFYLCQGASGGQPRLPATNPVQTYVDLSHCGGRGEEASEALLEQVLKGDWAVYREQS